jgi:hypothetical protein
MTDLAQEPGPPGPLDFAVSVDTRIAKDGKALSLVVVNGRGETVVIHLEPESAGRLGGILMANAVEAQKRAG